MFNSDMPMIRNKYYIMSKDQDWFVKNNVGEDFNFTGELDVAFNTYSKEQAFDICDVCNKSGMNVKVVILSASYTMWNRCVERK